MIIVGLQFGHDAGISVTRDGEPLVNFIRERHNGAKHSFGISVEHLEKTLDSEGLSFGDIDLFSITSGQSYELVVVDLLLAIPPISDETPAFRDAPVEASDAFGEA